MILQLQAIIYSILEYKHDKSYTYIIGKLIAHDPIDITELKGDIKEN